MAGKYTQESKTRHLVCWHPTTSWQLSCRLSSLCSRSERRSIQCKGTRTHQTKVVVLWLQGQQNDVNPYRFRISV